MTPKMEAALLAAYEAGEDGLRWTAAGWQGPNDGPLTYHGPVVVSRLVWHHEYLEERGVGRGKNARRVITAKGCAYIAEKAMRS